MTKEYVQRVTVESGDELPVHPSRILHTETKSNGDFFDTMTERELIVWYYASDRDE